MLGIIDSRTDGVEGCMLGIIDGGTDGVEGK
jgi:hypothetical protein